MSPVLQTGRYEIIETLGCGGTSRVDKARDTIIGRTVALKSFLQGFGRNSEQQFLREAQTIGSLSHSSIAQLYDVGHDASGAPFLVMEFVPGNNLEQLLAHSPIPFASAAVWAADLASALSSAHRAGIIHGDVTPSNIRVTDDDKVKLIDFGVARFASQVSGSDRVLGTPAYLSPEQIEGRKQDGRSDLFSLGIVLYEMITGVRPFDGNSLGEVCAQILTANPIPPSKLNPTLPAAFDRILARCLAKNPDERYQSGNDFARALYLVARCGDKLSAQPKRPYWFARPAHPRDLLAIAATVLLLASAVTAAGSLRDWVRIRSTPATAAAPAKNARDLAFGTNTRISTAPQVSAPAESVPPKNVPKTSVRKHSSTTPVPQAQAISPADAPPGQSPLR
ncbi:MAG TPA: serine/threonine-protein kinase [Candidatus Binatus sp.]|nr:serine/threonine-protein kinase [Candidatus Binatus sp.]